MSEFYMEQLVKRKRMFSDMIVPILLFTIAGLLITVSIVMSPNIMIIGWVIAGIGTYFWQRTNVEYEYLCLNGEVDIDKIFYKSKRKRLLTIKIEEVIVLAPVDHQEVKQHSQLKTLDYSSRIPSDQIYKAVISKGNEKFCILFEPKKEMVQALYNKAPRKVVL